MPFTSPPIPDRLYTPAQIGLVSAVASPFAAGWLMARNYRLLGEPDLATPCLLYSAIATLVLMALAFVLPDTVSETVLPIGTVLVIQKIAQDRQGPSIAAHRARGGLIGSWWIIGTVTLIGFLLLLALIAPLFLSLPNLE